MRSFLFFVFFSILIPSNSFAQDDLLSLLESEEEETTQYAFATFKTSRIINGHSIETHGGGVLQFLISHRFGRLNSGFKELFGIDNATIRLGFEYGITDRLSLGIGRSSFEKTYDSFVKYKVLRQSKGKRKMPFTLTALAGVDIKTQEWPEPDRENFFSSRVYYTFQAMFARKFNDLFSLQITPTLIHRNLVASISDKNDVFILGVGARQKISGSLSINAEYYWTPNGQIVSTLYGEDVKDAFSVGIDLETGGHVFQLHFTNSRGMITKAFATETTGSWLDGDIHFGFNVSRVFTVDKKPRVKKKNKE